MSSVVEVMTIRPPSAQFKIFSYSFFFGKLYLISLHPIPVANSTAETDDMCLIDLGEDTAYSSLRDSHRASGSHSGEYSLLCLKKKPFSFTVSVLVYC